LDQTDGEIFVDRVPSVDDSTLCEKDNTASDGIYTQDQAVVDDDGLVTPNIADKIAWPDERS
jgi:hypothetical protein